jgi:hypothetical protein
MKASLKCAGGALLCGLSACSGGDRSADPPQDKSTQTLAVASASTATDERIDLSRPVAVKLAPGATCTVYPSNAKRDPARTEFISAAADGIVRFYPPPSDWGTELSLDCEAQGQQSRQVVDLNDSTTFMTEPPLPNQKIVAERAPLTGDLSKLSLSELLRGQYPPRPDAATMPAQYAAWVDRVTRPYKIAAPVPTIRALGRHADPYAGHYTKTISNPQTEAAWAGEILNPTLAGTIVYSTYDAGMFVPNPHCGNFVCKGSVWGGLGGFNDGASGGLIQSGFWMQGDYCPQTSCGAGARSPVLFVEYAPGGAYFLPWEALNFSLGDAIYALGWSCDGSGNFTTTGAAGCFWFENATTQILSPPILIPKPTNPSGITFFGKTAEFIVEKPDNAGLANFGNQLMTGTAWEVNGTAHTNTTDPWAMFDIANSSGFLVRSFFPLNGGVGGPDQPDQALIGFVWYASGR